MNISPVAFLIVKGDSVRVLPVDPSGTSTLDRLVDTVPEVVEKVTTFLEKKKEDKETF